MQYINPFEILGIIPQTEVKLPLLIKKAKKRWLAEFELTGSTTIDINGHTFDRNDLLKLLEQVQHNAIFHFKLLQYPNLMDFLKYGDITFLENTTMPTWQVDKPFCQFIAPYFASQFDNLFSNAVKNNDFERLTIMTNYILPLPQRYHYECYKLTVRYWREQLKTLKRCVQKVNIYLIPERFEYFHATSTIDLLNLMPDAFFYTIRAQFAEELTQLGVNITNRHKNRMPRLAHSIVKSTLNLNLNPIDKSSVQYVMDQFNGLPAHKWGKGENNIYLAAYYRIKYYFEYYPNFAYPIAIFIAGFILFLTLDS